MKSFISVSAQEPTFYRPALGEENQATLRRCLYQLSAQRFSLALEEAHEGKNTLSL